MAVQVQFRRGNTSQHSTFTGAEGEITVNTEKDILVVHDGSTVSGHELARVNNPYFNGNVDFSNATFSSNLIPSANITYSLGSSTKRWANLYLSGNTIVIGDQSISSNSTTLLLGNTIFSGALNTSNALNVGGDVTITGNLIVTGTTLTVNTTTLDVKDLNITVAKGAANSAAADGAGLTIDGANATLTYVAATNTFNLSNYLKIGNSSINTTINATSFTGDSATVGGNTASNLNTYTDNKAANAYSNAVAFTNSIIIDSVTNTSITYIAAANSVKNSYDRAIDANTRAYSAQTEASNAYSNAVSYADNKAANAYSNAISYADNKAANAYSNAISYADGRIIDSVTNTSIAYAASANSVKNAYDRAIDANTRAGSAQTEASAAYTNAVSYTDSRIIDSVTNTSIAYAASANSVKNAYDRAIDANTRAYSAQTEASNAYSNAASYADAKAANAYSNAVAYSNSLIIDSVTNTSITYVAAANSVKNAYDRAIDANTRAYSAQTEASNAYTNAVAYANSLIIDSVTNTSITYAASANSVKNAYDRAIDANTRAYSAQTEASNAYSNATSYADNKAANAYSNAVAYANSLIIDSVTNTSIAYAASANSVKNAYDRAIDANTRAYSAQTEASNAYSNAAIFASNATNVNTGTLDEARLPHRMNQNVRTTDSVSFNDVSVTGNLTISGNTLIVGANNLVVSDAVISLHTPANLAALTSNDSRNIGLAFHYYDTEDKHALLYRDNTTGYLQYHTDGGDPISNSNPTGNSFGTIQAAIFWAGNSSVYTAVNATNYTGTSNNSLYLGGVAAADYQTETGLSANVATLAANSATYANQSITNTFTVGTASYFVANGNFGIANTTPDATLTVTGTANISGQSTFGNTVILGNIERNNISNTTTTTTQTAIDSFSATTYRSTKYIIQATNSTNYHYTEVAVVHDGTTAYATEFATMFTDSSLVSFAVDISGGNVRLLATATNATLTTYKIDRKLIKV